MKLCFLAVIAVAALMLVPAGFRTVPPSAEATLVSEVKKLLASDAGSSDAFGTSVAISGDTAIVGSVFSGVSLSETGAAYVFGRNHGGANNWGEVTRITASDAAPNANFGVSVAISGDTALVGAWNPGGMLAGAAYVFQRDHGGTDNWGEVKKLTASDATFGVLYGHSLAISDDTAVVGTFDDPDGTGAAFVYGRDEGGTDKWGEVKKLTASDAEAGDIFVFVGVSGDTIVVGAPREDTQASDAGAAYVFGRDEGGPDNWGELTKLTASDAAADTFFGTSVAVSGEAVVAGAQDLEGMNEGAAYVFERNAGGQDNWGEVAKLTASDGEAGDLFGEAVAASSATVVVGARWVDVEVDEEEDVVNVGAAYVFRRDEGGTGNWGEVGKLTASDAEANDEFGRSVGVTSSGAAVFGAWGDDDGGATAGAAYLFDLPKLQEPGDSDGDGCSDQRENGPDEEFGGLRDYKNPWDFYDVLGGGGGPPDQFIDLTNDIFGVIIHYAPTGSEPEYDVNFDRGPSTGPDSWNMTAPDEVIDLSTDILGVVLQYQHSCQ